MLINNKLYNLLKKILHLKDGCRSFKLEVDIDSLPIVTQSFILNNQECTSISNIDVEDFTTKAIPVEKFLEIAESCNKDSVFVIDSLTGVVN